MKQLGIKMDVTKWAERVGKRAAILAMVEEGIAFPTADKLAGGRYVSEPGPLLEKALRKAMGASIEAS